MPRCVPGRVLRCTGRRKAGRVLLRRRLAHGRLFPNLFVSATTFMLRGMRHFGRFPFLRYVTGTPVCPASLRLRLAARTCNGDFPLANPSFRNVAASHRLFSHEKWACTFHSHTRDKRVTELERQAGTLPTGRPRTHSATAPLV